MDGWSLRREIVAILVSILFLALGLVAVWLSVEFLKLEGDLVFVSLLLAPIIMYAVFSGRLSELRVGGLEAKFTKTAGQPVELTSETVEPSVEDIEIVAKQGLKELQSRTRQLDESKPIILTLTLGSGQNYYKPYALEGYMEALSQYRNFKFVVILDQENKFVAYIASWAMLQILRMGALGQEFVSTINEGNMRGLQRYPGVVSGTITTKSTNIEALSEMMAQNLEALVVINENRRLEGVVEREQLLSKLLLAMAR